MNKNRLFVSLVLLPHKNAYLRKKVKQDAVRRYQDDNGVVFMNILDILAG